jgi:outer membrane protein assembly factor BamB
MQRKDRWLIGKPLPRPVRRAGTVAVAAVLFLAFFAGDVDTYLGSLARTSDNPSKFLSLPLPPSFTFGTIPGGFSTQPIVSSLATGSPVVYVAGEDGNEYALDPAYNGKVLWQTNLGTNPECAGNPTAGVASTATIAS